MSIDLGTADESALEIQDAGQGAPSHDINVMRSSIHGGARTVFIHVLFSPDVNWNHDLLFLSDDFACGSHDCFQFSGGRDTLIADSLFHDPKGGGVLTAGATRVRVERNRFLGDKSVNASALQIATPGREWDNYAGVENMISSDITIANNLIVGWGGNGVELDACHDVRIVFDTMADLGGDGLHTWRRSPTDQQGNVILVGNEKIDLWNSILPSIALDGGDPRPVLEANNIVQKGGGGVALLTGDPGFADTTTYALARGSPAVDSGLVDPRNPADDLLQAARDAKPDRGALERGAKRPCP